MKEKISLKYGRKLVKFNYGHGNNLGVLSPKTIVAETEKEVVLNSLLKPVKSKALTNFINSTDRILIIIPDKTRLCRLKIVLPVILNILKKKKIRKENIRIIFANGSHSFQTLEEKNILVGSRILSRYKVCENNAYEIDEHIKFGRTEAGVEVYLNKILLETDKIITIGAVVHHYFAGFGGGAKLVMPGLAYYKTIMENHKKTILRTGEINPYCRSACLKNNPVYEEITEILRFVPPVFSINLIMNENGRIIRAKSGKLPEAHNEAAKIVDKYYKIKLKKKSDLVIVSAGGYPKDIDLIQSHKSIQNAYLAVRENGVIISLAECIDGIGSKTFPDWFKYKNEKQFTKALFDKYTLNAQTALSLKTKLKKVKIILVSSLPKELTEMMGFIPAENINEAFQKAEKFIGKNYSYYIIKNGSLVVPEII